MSELEQEELDNNQWIAKLKYLVAWEMFQGWYEYLKPEQQNNFDYVVSRLNEFNRDTKSLHQKMQEFLDKKQDTNQTVANYTREKTSKFLQAFPESEPTESIQMLTSYKEGLLKPLQLIVERGQTANYLEAEELAAQEEKILLSLQGYV